MKHYTYLNMHTYLNTHTQAPQTHPLNFRAAISPIS